ncbi:uncharacterized protein LOC116849168 isoform X2 [Odontomachus brunneus]|uniref:uncharacterized protein LOC116849168 isoform X2 n=1 Tax=Odontomachus brunneus TaxID=486640 RepID=UPI0013F1E59A|nr:uncharacterized protein LOC116849168 isoform X2 [Odontomachus brunneus]
MGKHNAESLRNSRLIYRATAKILACIVTQLVKFGASLSREEIMWVTKVFSLFVAVCVVSSNAYNMNRGFEDMLGSTFTNLEQNAKNMASNIKNTISTQSKTMTNYINNIKNETDIAIHQAGKHYMLDTIFHKIQEFLEEKLAYLKSLFVGGNTLIAIPDSTETESTEVNKDNESADSATSEKTSQLKEVEDST